MGFRRIESPALAGISSASVQGRVALGPRAGARVWRLGDDPDAPWVLSTMPRHAHLAGFDLHANVAVPATDRARLEQLCRYLLRPAVAQDRLRLLDDGRIVLTLKTAWADGTRQLLFEPLTLLEKLAALIPWPRINLVLYHGVLAPHCGWRARVVAYDAPPAVASPCPEVSDAPKSAPRHWAWAALMRRAFDVDVLACPRCGGRLRLIATVEDPEAIRAILAALAASREVAGRAPPATGRARADSQSRDGARGLSGTRTRSPRSVRWRLRAGPVPLDPRSVLVETPVTLVVRAVPGGGRAAGGAEKGGSVNGASMRPMLSRLPDLARHPRKRDARGLLCLDARSAVTVRTLPLFEDRQHGGEHETDDGERCEQIGERHTASVDPLATAVTVQRPRHRSKTAQRCSPSMCRSRQGTFLSSWADTSSANNGWYTAAWGRRVTSV